MDKLIWPITLVVCIVAGGLTAPGIIRAVKEPTVIVNPDDKPVVSTFAEDVRKAASSMTDQERDYALTQYEALAAVCRLSNPPKDDHAYQQVLEQTRTAYYGEAYPFKDSQKALNAVIKAECERRGLTRADKKAVDWDAKKWQDFAIEVKGIVEQ